MEERRRHHYTFVSFVQVCTSHEYDTVATLLLTSVIKHLHIASEVAKPDQQLGHYLRLPTGTCVCFCWVSQTRVQDLLLHAEHQEELELLSSKISLCFSHYSAALNVLSVPLTAVFGAGVKKLWVHQR